jgi:hypothetical protein
MNRIIFKLWLAVAALAASGASWAAQCPNNPNCFTGTLGTVIVPDVLTGSLIKRPCLFLNLDGTWLAIKTDNVHNYKEIRTVALLAKTTNASIMITTTGTTLNCLDSTTYPEIGGLFLL